jgi:hypothetical protein
MLGVGLFVVWVGYSLAYYGVDQVRGGNNGLLSLMMPGKYTDQAPDVGAQSPGTALPAGQSTIPTKGSSTTAPAVIKNTTAPAGQTGTFGVDQNGDLYKKVGGVWVPWGTTAAPSLGPA